MDHCTEKFVLCVPSSITLLKLIGICSLPITKNGLEVTIAILILVSVVYDNIEILWDMWHTVP